jgi:glycosyltransferase involved in cell wall biosynthesis
MAYGKEEGLGQRLQIISGVSAVPYYPLFDCYVSTSTSEGLSIALLEAMAFGKPCIITNSTATHPVIDHGRNGYLISLDEPVQHNLVHALDTMITQPAYAQQLGACARSTVSDRFDMQTIVGAYERCFDYVIRL